MAIATHQPGAAGTVGISDAATARTNESVRPPQPLQIGKPPRYQTSLEIRSRSGGSLCPESALSSEFPSSYFASTGAKWIPVVLYRLRVAEIVGSCYNDHDLSFGSSRVLVTHIKIVGIWSDTSTKFVVIVEESISSVTAHFVKEVQ